MESPSQKMGFPTNSVRFTPYAIKPRSRGLSDGPCHSFHPDQARRHALKELQNLAPAQLPPDQDISICGNPMDLENILCQVLTVRNHLVH